jgi:hypothetical protein
MLEIGGGGGAAFLGPQSLQSVPIAQMPSTAPLPPSLQMPFEESQPNG